MPHSLIPTIVALVGLVLVVLLADLMLLIFAAILIAAVFDAAIGLMRKVVPIGRYAALGIAITLSVALFAVAAVAGGVTLFDQLDALSDALGEAWQMVAGHLNSIGVPAPRTFHFDDVVDSLPEPQTMFGGAGAILGRGLQWITNLVIVVLMGIFLAIDPPRYRDGLVLLAPPAHRLRLRSVLDKVGTTLQRWLVGQLVLMVIVGTGTMALLLVMGISYAVPLGLIAGLLNFIPFVGPILAFVPIGLAMLGQDLTTALVVLAGYTLIQQLDANLFTPLIQDRVVSLAPALSIAFLLVMGVLTGPLGVALATPLLAALRVLVLELYVREVLRDPENGAD